MHVLILSAEPRLIELAKSFVGAEHNFVVVQRWTDGQSLLFKERFDLVCLDYEVLKTESLDAFITIDNILAKENTVGCLMVRAQTPQTSQLHQSLASLRELVDMSQGKQSFQEHLSRIAREASAQSVRHSADRSVENNQVIQVEGSLPSVERGRLDDVPLTRVLYALHERKSTGFLKVSAPGRSGEIALDEGEIKIAAGYATLPEIVAMFAWSNGDYLFTNATSPGGKRERVLDVIQHGLMRIPQQQLLHTMDRSMDLYPIPTNLWDERAPQHAEFTALHAFLRVLDGRSTLTQVLSKMGSLAQEAFKGAYYAILTDLVYLNASPNARGAVVTYPRDVRLARDRVDEAARQQTKAFRATSDDTAGLERELQDTLMGMKAMTPHQIFGVWEGCGKKAVQERFYVLVKEHHPDVYGGNVSGRVKQLAQDIFILVKNTYAELQKLERGEQTVAPPATAPVGISRTGTAKVVPAASSAAPETGSRAATPNPEPRVDVKSAIQRMSGFRQKQQERQRRISSHGAPLGDEESDWSEASEADNVVSEPSEPEPDAEALRQEKLKLLMQKASKVNHPNAPNPARDAFNAGYKQFKENQIAKAFPDLKRAWELAPTEPLYQTFYAHTLFKLQPEKHEEAEKILTEVLQSGNKQAAPDAYLFLAHIYKSRNDMDKALKLYERALKLNPGCVEAEREIRHAAIRDKRTTSDPGPSFIKNLFKK